ncbi:MAG: copper chaperone Copz family protein [Candidatus Omnitrophica bacterium]|nr:copper chaperone Copz family protein [Candidatus Omnitrophota bacterium]
MIQMEKCCKPKRKARAYCPECANEGKPVKRITLENLLKALSQIEDEPYWFCATFECPAVYFSSSSKSIFHKLDLKVRVGIKESENPIPLCYCFGWNRKKIWDEIRETGNSTAIESITKEVKAGRCFCERSNPQGTCCLANISNAVKDYGLQSQPKNGQ